MKRKFFWLFVFLVIYFHLAGLDMVYGAGCGLTCSPTDLCTVVGCNTCAFVPASGGSICVTPTPTPTTPPGPAPISSCDCDSTSDVCTALGCIPTETTGFVVWVLKNAIGIGGGIAFILIISGAFQVMTSSGNPEGIKKGTEMIASAIGGLIFIIFSLFLLKLIGVDILKIPGFTP